LAAGSDVKKLLKVATKHAARLAGGFFPRAGARILTYHSVGARVHDMNVTPANFAAQMEWLAANARVICLAEAADGCEGVAITFDDGYRDNLTNAAHVLRALRLTATCFICTGRMGGVMDPCEDSAAGALMTWNEARELAASGIDIGAHTMTHPHLSQLCEEDQRREIAESASMIAEQFGYNPEAFAYPYGSSADYNAASIRLVREAGFRYAVSNRYGVNPPGSDRWTLRRIWIDTTDTLDTFQAKVTGQLDALALLDSAPGIALRRGLNRALRVR
jgi:peptidoglycan/xylan/chitin deacetylase (PgdA/CDA1 family)